MIEKEKISIIKKIMLIFSIPICAVISIGVTLLYNPSNLMMVELDKLLSNRLNQGMKGITEYGISLFGQKIIMRGNGGTSKSIIEDYFFIDSSYLSIALKYGIILLVIFCIYYIIYNKRQIESGNILLPTLILFIGINSIVAHHFIDVAYNPFILAIFTLNKDKYKKYKK